MLVAIKKEVKWNEAMRKTFEKKFAIKMDFYREKKQHILMFENMVRNIFAELFRIFAKTSELCIDSIIICKSICEPVSLVCKFDLSVYAKTKDGNHQLASFIVLRNFTKKNLNKTKEMIRRMPKSI